MTDRERTRDTVTDESSLAGVAAIHVKALAGGVLAADGGAFVVVEWTAAGGDPAAPQMIAPLHVHLEDDEAWYVLDGALGVRVGDEDVRVAAGGAVFVPRGTPHTYWNALATPTRYLLVMTPQIKRLIDALHAVSGGEELEPTFAAHASEFLGWP